jgi:hypothetical protein
MLEQFQLTDTWVHGYTYKGNSSAMCSRESRPLRIDIL